MVLMMNQSQKNMLAYLREHHEPVSQWKLAKILSYDYHTIQLGIARLELAGKITVKKSDKNHSLIYLVEYVPQPIPTNQPEDRAVSASGTASQSTTNKEVLEQRD